jgi:putative inorganic carbon (HCO3(-)) transporter
VRDLLVAAIVFGLLPFVLRQPFIGILLAAGLGFMVPHRLCYGFMMTMPVVQIVAIVTLIGMLASKEAKRMIWSREITVLVVFVAWMGLTTSQAFYFDLAWEQYVKVVKIQILTFMTLLMLTSRQRVHLFVWVIVLSLGFYGVKGGIFTIIQGGVHRVQGPLGSFIGGNNEMALALVMTIPLIRYLHLQESRQLLKQLLAIAMVLTALAAVGSQSRGALVALALTGGIFWLKSRNKFPTAFFILIAVGLVAFVMPEEWYERMSTIKSYEQDASAMGRVNAWWTAFNMANDRIFGGGFEAFGWIAFSRYAPDPGNIRDVHSIYFEVMGEHGWPGFVLYIALLGLTWRKCSSIIRIASRRSELLWARDLAAMVQVSLIGYMSAGAFLGLAYFDYVYSLIVIVVVVHYIATHPEGQVQSSSLLDALRPPPQAGMALRS